MWKKLRIAILLFILATVALSTWRGQTQARDWHNTLHVAIFPINGDGSAAAAARIAGLNDSSFKDIDDFLTEQAAEYGNQTTMAVRVTLQPELHTAPPAAPAVSCAHDTRCHHLESQAALVGLASAKRHAARTYARFRCLLGFDRDGRLRTQFAWTRQRAGGGYKCACRDEYAAHQ